MKHQIPKKGQVFVPHDKKYPEEAIEVLSVEPSENEKGPFVHFCSLGGGWQETTYCEDLMKAFRSVSRSEKLAAEPYATQIGIDDMFDPTLNGYTFGDRWNGWAKPFFEKEDAIRVMEVFKGIITYDEDQQAFVVQFEDDDEPVIHKAQQIVVNGEVKTVFDIGAGNITWEDRGPSQEQKLAARNYKKAQFDNDSPSP